MKYKIKRNNIKFDNILSYYKYKNIKCSPLIFYWNNYFEIYIEIGNKNYSARINKRYSHKILILEFISSIRRLKDEY